MRNIFINPTTNVIRAGWRIVIFVLIFLTLNIALMSGTRAILGSLPATGTLWFFLLGIAGTLATYITTKYISKQPFNSLGLNWKYAFKDLFIGILISALIMTFMYLTLLSLGYIEFNGFSWWKDDSHTLANFSLASMFTALVVFFQFIVVAWWEELAFRGIILQNITSGLNVKWGVLISTLGFGLIHAGNPNATVLSTILIMVITFKLVFAYLKSGQLWLPIGLHLGWNFFQASIFGFASSGHMSPSLIAQTPVAPDWLSGGVFGAENSILIIPFTLASFYLMHVWIKHSRKLKNYKMSDFLITNDSFKEGNTKVTNIKSINI